MGIGPIMGILVSTTTTGWYLRPGDIRRGILGKGATWLQLHRNRGPGVRVPVPHPLRWSRRGYRYLDKCRPSQVPATSRSGAREPQERLRIGVRAEKEEGGEGEEPEEEEEGDEGEEEEELG